ncbi:MAG: isoprenylcysteine carboxylmethyltransferase family protein [Pseudomonadota bacterium]
MQSVPYQAWYGDWQTAVFSTVFFGLFFLGCLFPRQAREWRSLGLLEAFFIAFFAEMFGFPLTLYLVSPLLGERLGHFGLFESHIWAYLLARAGMTSLHTAVGLVLNLTVFMVGLGCLLVVFGWLAMYEAQGRKLATNGIYRMVRHPQYLGLMILVTAFLIQWPTLPGLVMGPVLLRLYYKLGLREEAELERALGAVWLEYATRVPRFLPWPRPGNSP